MAPDRRFRRNSRLLDKPSYSRVFERAGRSRDKMFTVLFRANGSGQPRLGIVIAKKQCRLASDRNRLKRIVRESFRLNRDGLPGADLVVLNQPAAATANNKALFDSLAGHWKKVAAQEASKGRNE